MLKKLRYKSFLPYCAAFLAGILVMSVFFLSGCSLSGANNGNSSVFLPSQPDGIEDIRTQILTALQAKG